MKLCNNISFLTSKVPYYAQLTLPLFLRIISMSENSSDIRKKKSILYLFWLAWHSQTHNSLHKCIHFTYGSNVEFIHDVAEKTQTILVNRSPVSLVGRALVKSSLVAASITCFAPLLGVLYVYPISCRGSFVYVSWHCRMN